MIEKTMLDGRLVERHTSFNEDGDKIIEIFTEEKRPLHLEKRIVQKHKQVLAEECVEHIQGGEVIEREVRSIEPPKAMQVKEHIALAEHPRVIDGEYVSKQDIGPVVMETVLALLNQQKIESKPATFSAQQMLADRVEETNSADNNKNITVIAMVVLIVIQLAACYFYFF